MPSSAQAASTRSNSFWRECGRSIPAWWRRRESVGAADAQVSQAWRQWAPTGQITAGFTLVPSRCIAPVFNDLGVPVHRPATGSSRLPTTQLHLHRHQHGQRLNSGVFKLKPGLQGRRIQLTQPIYTSGKIEAAVKAAKAGRDVSRAQVDAAVADATLNAVRAYWGLKWARASAATLDEGRGRIKEWVDKIDKEIDKDTSSYTEQDLMRLKMALNNLELGLLDLRKAERVALAGLRTRRRRCHRRYRRRGARCARAVRAAAQLLRGRGLAASARGAHARRRAQCRPSVGQPAAGGDAARHRHLVTGFNYSYARDVDTPNNAFMSHANSSGFNFALALKQPLDFGPRLAKLSQARAEERAFSAKRREALGGIALEIEKAFADVGRRAQAAGADRTRREGGARLVQLGGPDSSGGNRQFKRHGGRRAQLF